jgi:hypothetical protein
MKMAIDEEARYRLRRRLVDVLGADEAATMMSLLPRWEKLKSDIWFGLKLAGIFVVYVIWLFVVVPALAR